MKLSLSSHRNTYQTNTVNNNRYGWDQSIGKAKRNKQNSDACETIINFVTFCVNLLPTTKANFVTYSKSLSVIELGV